uniref:ABC transporter permease n=1 Tax=Agarophyton chilense TaxID=2510777 RepID=A0A141SEP7_AGACH|nr:hypothetical protein Gchil_112 [Agarophyton chilense]AMK96765.1 hypothetical protein Gchil_112 [Agarophyton chilense]ASP44660.1 hypothetical protein [Agarophyton chilense]UAD84306.1 hypothetical protein [Agarophyton chilense]
MFKFFRSFIDFRINKKSAIQLLHSSYFSTLEQIKIVGPDSLNIVIITAFFLGMVFTIQIVKEFLYINAVTLVGSVLTITFIRELSPVLTSVIIVGRIASYFTAELATMSVTEQLNALYLLETNPLKYLVLPRVISCIIMLPCLSVFSFITSLFSSSFICFTIYSIHPEIFFVSSLSSLIVQDIFKALLKTTVFGFLIASISCFYGLKASGGAKGVGKSTTSSVVTSLLAVFIFDFLLSYIMFSKLGSSIKAL